MCCVIISESPYKGRNMRVRVSLCVCVCVSVTVVAVGRKSKERKKQCGLFSHFSPSVGFLLCRQQPSLFFITPSPEFFQLFFGGALDTVCPVLFLDHDHLYSSDTRHLGYSEGKEKKNSVQSCFFLFLSLST